MNLKTMVKKHFIIKTKNDLFVSSVPNTNDHYYSKNPNDIVFFQTEKQAEDFCAMYCDRCDEYKWRIQQISLDWAFDS